MKDYSSSELFELVRRALDQARVDRVVQKDVAQATQAITELRDRGFGGETQTATTKPARPTIAERLAQVEQDLAAFKASHALVSGEPAQVLDPAQQDAKSWALIEKWWEAREPRSACYGLNVEVLGPYASSLYYARLPNGHTARGNTRSDALAHAAEYCKAELEK